MKQMKPAKLIMFVFLFLSMANSSFSQPGDAGQPGEFLRYGIGARALGLGRAFVSVADDASAIYWNPAGLLNVQQNEIATMYTNLFYDSRYTYWAVAVPRTYLGAKSAFGFAWVNLSTVDFDQRNQNNEPLGDFDFHEQAFMLSYARELVGTLGILNYGGNLKLIDQGFSGLDQSQSSGLAGDNSGRTFGMDWGVTFQPINIYILQIISLKYLLPLKIGLSVQNLWQQKVGDNDVYPRIWRCGSQYGISVKDWKVMLVYDQERFSGRRTGHYGGMEITKPFRAFQPWLRIGLNNRTDKFTCGGGIRFGFTDVTALRMDYAFSSHSQLKSDSRFFLTVEFGKHYDANYFSAKAKQIPRDTVETRRNHLQVIARYPNEKIVESATALAKVYDTKNEKRYYKLVGGLDYATWLFNKAKEDLRTGDTKAAKKKAGEAINEYASEFKKRGDEFDDVNLLNYGEALMIVKKWEDALGVMKKVQSALRYHYQAGICNKNLKKWIEAIYEFREGLKNYDQDEKSMRCLSLLSLGEALMEKGSYEAALDTFAVITKKFQTKLDEDYPRYPSYRDDEKQDIHNIADDAQYFIGECYLKLGDEEKALNEFAKVGRFYPNLQKVAQAEEEVDRLVKKLKQENNR